MVIVERRENRKSRQDATRESERVWRLGGDRKV